MQMYNVFLSRTEIIIKRTVERDRKCDTIIHEQY